MAQRPTIHQPKPLSPVDPKRLPEDGTAAAQMLGSLQSEISEEAAPLWNFVLDNARVIAAAVLGVIVLIVAYGGWQWYKEDQAATASLEFGKISARTDAAVRLRELEAFAAKAPAAIAPAVHMELAAAAVALEDWPRAASAYQTVADREHDSPLALVARLNRADMLLRQGEAATALAELESIPSTRLNSDTFVQLQEQIAAAALEAGHTAKAIQAYEAILARLTPAQTSEAAFYQALIASLQ